MVVISTRGTLKQGVLGRDATGGWHFHNAREITHITHHAHRIAVTLPALPRVHRRSIRQRPRPESSSYWSVVTPEGRRVSRLDCATIVALGCHRARADGWMAGVERGGMSKRETQQTGRRAFKCPPAGPTGVNSHSPYLVSQRIPGNGCRLGHLRTRRPGWARGKEGRMSLCISKSRLAAPNAARA